MVRLPRADPAIREVTMARLLDLPCADCPYRYEGVFAHLTDESSRTLDGSKLTHVLPPGHQLFDEGGPPLAVHCIRRGAVKVYKSTRRGEEQIIRILRDGDLAGYRAVLAGEPFGATAETLTETTVCTVPAATILALARTSPDFALDLLSLVARELRVSEEILIDLPHRSVRQRLAAVLLLLTETREADTRQRHAAAVRLSRRDLARLVAATPESISRALRRLADEGAVACIRTEIRLVDRPRLRRSARSDLDRRQAET
jgi:CRP/FNR family transcriptional regulator, polysaccharide utilization system transcription regulator